jgi:hypothetical protein
VAVATPLIVLPYVIANLIGLGLVVLAWRRPGLARAAVAFGFVGAALFNAHEALTRPASYLAFARSAVPPYPWLIDHVFALAPAMFVLSIAIVQLAGGLLFGFGNRALARTGGFALIAFLIAIAPFGYGSAFPATLLYTVAIGHVLSTIPVRSPFARLHRAA